MRTAIAGLWLLVSGSTLQSQRGPAVELHTDPAAPVQSQRGTMLEVRPASTPSLEGPSVRSVGVLDDPQLRDLLNSGFPARLHYRLEFWTVGGWFNDLKGSTEWDVVIRYVPLDKSYRVARIFSGRVQETGPFERLVDAQTELERAFIAPLRAARGERGYYNLVLDVETLSLGDLDEVERWLRGELQPAVHGRRNPGTALTRGLRTLFVRLLGGERRHFEVRSSVLQS